MYKLGTFLRARGRQWPFLFTTPSKIRTRGLELLESGNMEGREPCNHLFRELFPPAGPGLTSAAVQPEPAYRTRPPPGPTEPPVDARLVEPVGAGEDVHVLTILQPRQAHAAPARLALGAGGAQQY